MWGDDVLTLPFSGWFTLRPSPALLDLWHFPFSSFVFYTEEWKHSKELLHDLACTSIYLPSCYQGWTAIAPLSGRPLLWALGPNSSCRLEGITQAILSISLPFSVSPSYWFSCISTQRYWNTAHFKKNPLISSYSLLVTTLFFCSSICSPPIHWNPL